MLQTDGFDYPCGAPDGKGYYVAAGLVEQPYYRRFRAWHTGEDWNASRPPRGDVDLGDPIYAVANGLVKTADYFVPSWGNVIVIEHEMADGSRCWSQYAHCQQMKVREGDEVRRGQKIGTIGKGAGNRWPAHLHFEIRVKDVKPNAWGWSRDQVLERYAHPTNFIKANRPGLGGPIIAVDEKDSGFTRSESDYWRESSVGYRGHSYWTWTVDENQGEDCVAEWIPRLEESGVYEVMVYIPRLNASTHRARYQVTHRRDVEVVTVDQSRYYDEWASLGRFPFSTYQPAGVRLSDLTGEPYTRDRRRRKAVAFDAVRFIMVEE